MATTWAVYSNAQIEIIVKGFVGISIFIMLLTQESKLHSLEVTDTLTGMIDVQIANANHSAFIIA